MRYGNPSLDEIDCLTRLLICIVQSSVSQTVCRGTMMCCGKFAGVPWFAPSPFQVLFVVTNFLRKLRKCCHYKSRQKSNGFFWKSTPFVAASRDFRRSLPRKVVIFKKIKKRSLPFSLSPVMPLDINWNRFERLMSR